MTPGARPISDQELAEYLGRKAITIVAPAFVAPVIAALSRAEEDRRIAEIMRPRALTRQEYVEALKKQGWSKIYGKTTDAAAVPSAKKRGRGARRLTPEQVTECRGPAVSVAALARQFGVSETTISRIRRRECYKDLP